MADYADNSENDKAESIYQESFNIKNGILNIISI